MYCLQISNRKYPRLKEVDDVLGGAAAWENVDSTAGNDSNYSTIHMQLSIQDIASKQFYVFEQTCVMTITLN